MNQKTVTILSMSFVVVAAVAVNEFVLKASSSDQDRQVASFGERFEPDQIKWEQELANTISKDSQSKVILGSKPNLQDRLLFEVFEGHYQAQLSDGKINKISLLPNQNPIEINTAAFIKDYITLMKESVSTLKDFDSFEQKAISASSHQIDLKNKSGASIGNLTINHDDQGRVLSIEIQ